MTARRFFVGLELDEATRDACRSVADRLQAMGYPARYEDPRKFHATLAFLGNVDPSRFEAIAGALAQAAMAGAAFELTLDKLGAFPHERKPRIVYIGARDQGASFRSLAGAVRSAFEALGFRFKDDAVAHVTVARVRAPRRPLPGLDIEPMRLHAQRISLFESLPDAENDTSRYEIIESAPLLAAWDGFGTPKPHDRGQIQT